MNEFDTICAISTSISESAINIIRLSGDKAISIVASIFDGKNLNKIKPWTITHGHIIDEEKNVIDEVLVSVFKAPKSYTREDMVEINTHGGSFVTHSILSLILKKGARLADSGEFTKRAFLNGRIDLSEAEAVMDVINSKSRKALDIANKSLSGGTYNLIHNIRNDLEDLLLHITINIDYPEYTDEVQITKGQITSTTNNLIDKIKDVLNKANTFKVYREGIKTIILGKPNVGKSSLLNALLNEDKAIVTNISGTTRDIVEGELNLSGIILHLIDTAGIRDTSDPIEKIGISKSLSELDEAELVLLILDNSTELSQEDKNLLELTKNKKRIVLLNKSDLGRKNIDEENALSISALTKEGLPSLEKMIKEMFVNEEISSTNDALISSSRHISILNKVLDSLISANLASRSGEYTDMVMIDLTSAYNELGLITGETASDSLINELFKKFCLGK